MEAFYSYMQNNFDALFQQALSWETRDSYRRPLDYMDLRGNVMEDMLIQCTTQLQFAKYCLEDAALMERYALRIRDIASFILDSVAMATTLICAFADMYFGSSARILP